MTQSGSAARILVVDTNRSCAQRYSAILRDAGYTDVASAANTRRALQECRREVPRLLIIDPWVEGGCGYEIAESLSETLSGAGAPRILFVTADASEGPRIQAELFGASAVVEKPCGADELLQQVRMALTV